MGPFEDGGPWNPKGLIGIKRFLDKYWELAQRIIDCQTEENPQDLIYSSQEIEETVLAKLVSKTIRRVGDHIEDFKFNTAISFMMEAVNEMQKLMEKMPTEKSPGSWRDTLERFSIILSPFAPHLTEEIWEDLGHGESIFAQSWPEIDEALAEDEIFNIVIQVNGKVRGTVEVTKGASQKEVARLAEIVPNVKKYLASSKREKEIFVKDRLINFIVK
jgi:leucyl-tRNA synthetase